MNNPDDNQVMTVREVAEFLQFSQTKVYRCLNLGEIPGKKIGGQWRMWRPALEEYMRRQATPLAGDEPNVPFATLDGEKRV